MSLKYAPRDGSVFLPETVDYNMEYNPDLTAYTFLGKDNQNVESITHREFGRAVHRAAEHIRPGRTADKDDRTVAMVVNTDTLLSLAVVFGVMKAGWIPFPISHRNSPEAVASLMANSNAEKIITQQHAFSDLITVVSERFRADHNKQIEVIELPTLKSLFPHLAHETAAHDFTPYPPRAKRTALETPALYIHSSGSTGLPKAIAQTNKHLSGYLFQDPMLMWEMDSQKSSTAGMHLPYFHIMGLHMFMSVPQFFLTAGALFPPTSFDDPHAIPVIPDPVNFIEHAQKLKCGSIVSIPSFLEIWSRNPEIVAWMATVSFVIYGGGPLAREIGDGLVDANVNISNMYGATEIGAVCDYRYDRKTLNKDTWSYLTFSKHPKIHWEPQGDGLFECHIFANPDSGYVPAKENVPGGYKTNDLFEPHPKHDGLWKLVGRKDDVIVLSNGEKAVPGPFEDAIMTSGIIKGVVMTGSGRLQVSLLLEPTEEHQIDPTDDDQVEDLRRKIWTFVEVGNRASPAFAHVFKEAIIFTSGERPMVRAAKGTVQGKLVLKEYAKEVERLYETLEASSQPKHLDLVPTHWSVEENRRWLLAEAMDVLQKDGIHLTQDLFSQGFDSLTATLLRNRIVGALKDSEVKSAAHKIDQNFVFNNPTVERMATVIHRISDGKDAVGNDSMGIEEMIKKYAISASLPPFEIQSKSALGTVLLSGSTGGLGSHLLQCLLASETVNRIFAFNRSSPDSSIEQRQRDAFVQRGLNPDLLQSPKLTFIIADTSKPNFGLPGEQYEEIRDSTTTILHSAWKLDFNMTLPSFEPHVRGVRQLIDMAMSGPHSKTLRFIFASSIASAQGWRHGLFPEEEQLDPSIAKGTGYSESKFVSERILASSGLNFSSLRIGQITGSSNGAWAKTDWVPILIQSGLKIGALPDVPGLISWIRPEAVAGAIIDFAANEVPPAQYLNIVHHKPIEWSKMIGWVKDSAPHDIKLVSIAEWVKALESRSREASTADLDEIPAIKLLPFFQALASANESQAGEAFGATQFKTEKARQASPTLEQEIELNEEDIKSWMRFWRF